MLRVAGLMLVASLVAGCDSAAPGDTSEIPDTFGSFAISIETTGVPQHPGPYTILIDGQAAGDILLEGNLVVDQLRTGEHSLSLTNVAETCSIAEAASMISISAERTTTLHLLIECPSARIVIDAGHVNGHVLHGTYGPLAEMLIGEGYTVADNRDPFTPAALADADILVISNALHPNNEFDWSEPIFPAFTGDEVSTVRAWVEAGGSLLFVADHMPFPAATADLAAAFGVSFSSNFAFDPGQLSEPVTCLDPDQIHVFRRADGTLGSHFVTEGRSAEERIDSVATFTGQAFPPVSGLTPVLSFGPGAIALLPTEAWSFSDSTPRQEIAAWLQGGVLEFGAGRVAFLGEAAMFTTQTCWSATQQPMGMQAPVASQNAQFARNMIFWLAHFD